MIENVEKLLDKRYKKDYFMSGRFQNLGQIWGKNFNVQNV